MKTGVTVYIGLGSNLDDPVQQIITAFEDFKNIPFTQLIKTSSLYRNPPLENLPQPDFINAVVELNTQLNPEQLLDELQNVEFKHGRVRPSKQWGEARPLDLDILLYGDLTIHSERLTIPHYALMERNFFLFPLCEIAPDLCLPNGELLQTYLKSFSDEGLEKVAE